MTDLHGSAVVDPMRRAIANAARVRCTTSPNPWVGAVVVGADGRAFDGATEPPGGRHAEIVALDAAASAAHGATLYTTLEPCVHTGRTGPCVEAIVARGVTRVVYAIDDPDPLVAGRARSILEAAGIEVVAGVLAAEVSEQLAPYLAHRRTGRPYVVLKLAATLDGRLAAPDGTSRWITGAEARADVHRLRAASDAICVGAGTVRADDPELTTRNADGPSPLRIVLGAAPATARAQPCREFHGEPTELLDQLGAEGIVQLLVEGGAHVAGEFHRAGLVDRYVIYFAPKLAGGDDSLAMFAGPGITTMSDVWRGQFAAVRHLGDDLRIDVTPASAAPAGARPRVTRVVETVLPTAHAEFRCYGYTTASGGEHVALLLGDVASADAATGDPLVRIHSECLTGDVLGSRRCDCGPQLEAATRTIAEAGRGVIVYLRGHEGRGIGLLEKLRAYRLQDDGLDTVDANLELGHPADGRDYGDAAAILTELGVTRVRLLSNNPDKRAALEARGVAVSEVVTLIVAPNEHNARYLATKRERLGHLLPAF